MPRTTGTGERIPLRVKMVNGHTVPLHPEDCEPHTPAPDGYLQWHEWAQRMDATHDQRQCKGCGLWAIWEPKPAGAETSPRESCETCMDSGVIPVPYCTCGNIGDHEPGCGYEPCPAGCPVPV